jgi:hypothetical protein
MVPGVELAGVLETVEPSAVTDAYDLVELVAACRRIKAWADAVEIERRPRWPGIRSVMPRRRLGTVSPRFVPRAS